MNAVRRGILVLVTAASAWALAVTSGVSAPWHAADATALRLSWSARPERVETCRTLDAEELAQLPVHMRREVVCEGRAANYELTVAADGDMLDHALIGGGGLRHDRLIYLFRDYPLPEGPHRVFVRFTRAEQVDSSRTPNAIAPDLVLDTLVVFRRGSVVLVTYADGALALRAP